jgi:exopolyphosphatase / guanosine-5'-triphosphate,3'-diphosphate pyrophosphatase
MPASVDDSLIRELLSAPIAVPDDEHALRCARFAGELFDAIHLALGLSPEHKRLAIAAALFHDVGYLRGDQDHHRKSFDIIRRATIPGLSHDERLIVACAARYHGRTSPNIEHAGFGEMSFEDQRLVRRTAAITRVAVALDASHLGLIDDIEVHAGERDIRVIAYVANDAAVERDRLREAAGGFTGLTQTPMRTDVRRRSDAT